MRKTRMLAAAAGAAAMVMVPATGAFAHNCFIIDRNVNFVGERGGYYGVDVNAAIAEEVAAGFYTAEQGECVANKLPDKIAIKVRGTMGHDFVLIRNNPNATVKSADGKGVETIDAIFESCGVFFPDEV